LLKNKIKKYINKLLKNSIEYNNNYITNYDDLLFIFDKYVNFSQKILYTFSFDEFSKRVLNFSETLKINDHVFSYRYSPSVSKPTIYGSVYSCLLYFLLNSDNSLSKDNIEKWGQYLNSFQNEEGYYIDNNIENELFYNIDWWGARHIPPHVIIALNYIGIKPKYEFNYIKKYYDKEKLKKYIDSLDFKDIIYKDPDNSIMNLGVLLQYQRDYFNDEKAGNTLNTLIDELEKQINPKWGSWGYGSDDDMMFLSRTQQFAYHLYPLWLYDKKPIKYIDRLIDLTLKTQTKLGGFGAYLNSSACEDIDAIFLLIKLSELTDYRKEDIINALQKAFQWVFVNQNDDGGFVFRRNESFTYGHEFMGSKKNESHLFATWFRTLSIAYLTKYL
jgi:hypothetical protein